MYVRAPEYGDLDIEYRGLTLLPKGEPVGRLGLQLLQLQLPW
jgi:hypothetical protein